MKNNYKIRGQNQNKDNNLNQTSKNQIVAGAPVYLYLKDTGN